MKLFVIVVVFSAFLQISCSKVEQKELIQKTANLDKPQVSQSNISPNTETKFGYIADEKTAIDTALKIWIPIYGKETIEREKPYHATLKNGIWTVAGSLPEGMDGGVAMVNISQKDGRILKVIHGQ